MCLYFTKSYIYLSNIINKIRFKRGNIYIPYECGKCGSMTILHNLIFEIPVPLRLVMEENRVTELAIGYSLARLEDIESVCA